MEKCLKKDTSLRSLMSRRHCGFQHLAGGQCLHLDTLPLCGKLTVKDERHAGHGGLCGLSLVTGTTWKSPWSLFTPSVVKGYVMDPLFRAHIVQKTQQSNFIRYDLHKGAEQLLMPKDFYPSRTGLESPGHDPASAQLRDFSRQGFSQEPETNPA